MEPSVFHTMPLKALKQEVSLYENKFNRMLVTTLPFAPPVSDVLSGQCGSSGPTMGGARGVVHGAGETGRE